MATNTPPINPEAVEALNRAAASWARSMAELPGRAAEAAAAMVKLAKVGQMDEA